MNFKEELLELYAEKSQHSQYQKLASYFDEIISKEEQPTSWRFEEERMSWVVSHYDMSTMPCVLDIGGNTGYFTFESVRHGASKVDYYEGNLTHCDFVKKGADYFGLSDRITVHREYFDFDEDRKERWDLAFCLNVMHHLGGNFGDLSQGMISARNGMIETINHMAGYVRMLVFQNGFNWKGDIKQCLFENGTKREMIDWLRTGTSDYWEMGSIGIAEGSKAGAVYRECNEKNIERDDSMGEFLNRPLFIMKSKILR